MKKKHNRDEVCFSQGVAHCQVNATPRKYKVPEAKKYKVSFPQGYKGHIILKAMEQNDCYWTSSAEMRFYIYI